MKKVLLLCFAIFLLQSTMLAQSPDTMWTKTLSGSNFTGYGWAVQQTRDGGYIVAGPSGNFWFEDVFLIKTDSVGDTLWTKTYGGDNYECGFSVQQTSDEGYIVVGLTHSFGEGGKVLSEDIYLIKTDPLGDTLWTRTYGGVNNDCGRSVQQTSDGGYILVGSTGTSLFSDVYLIKTDLSGNTLWTKTFTRLRYNEGNSVQQTSDGGYILAGFTRLFDAENDEWIYCVSLIKLAPSYVYIYDIISDRTNYSTSQDTVHISTIIENLYSHQLTARAYIFNSNNDLIDSTDLAEQEKIKDAEKWTGEVIAPPIEDFFKVSVNVSDQTINDHFVINNAARFTTAGPLKVDSFEYVALSNFKYGIKPVIKNEGNTLPISNIKLKVFCNDPWVKEIYPSIRICYDILPGETKLLPLGFSVAYDSATYPGYFNLEFEMLSDGWLYWTDSSTMKVVTGIEEELTVPSVFSLEQNYPNPFNPSTKIKYSIPKQTDVTLKVFDLLGSEVATIINKAQPRGNYEVEFDGIDLTSGIYFYRLQAVDFIDVKKMILIK